MNSWLLINSGNCDAAYNMALDEALLESMPRLGRPALRFYGWKQPAATFGYFQKFSEVEAATHLRPLIRRPTGGGLVPHDADWTYSTTFPVGHDWHSLKAEQSYRRVHEWLRQAFAKLNVETGLAADRKKSLSGRCFAGHEKFDLLWHGTKMAGAAQRRNKFGLLIQGSVQPPVVSPVRGDWERAMVSAAIELFAVPVEAGVADAELLAVADQKTAGKFSQEDYCQRR